MPRFPGSGGMDIGRLMKQAQKLQAEMAKTEEELANRVVEGTSGGGMVRVTVTCGMQFKSIEIEKEAVDPDDVEMLQDLILAAINSAVAKADETRKEEMAKVTGMANMPLKF
ncbi:MAG: YbaB/EbfC family nucleoid-associated protein [Bacillota bacterium]|jgi:DNA-binding YbaB/EbfC family protein